MSALVDSIVKGIERDTRRRYPARDDVSMSAIESCDPRLIDAYRTGVRVRVLNRRHGNERTGTVSRTTGWVPSLMLMIRSNQRSSSDLLGPDDVVTHVQHGRKYMRVTR